MKSRNRLSEWLKRKWSEERPEVADYAVKTELARFDALTKSMSEPEKSAFVDEWIRQDKISDQIDSFSRKAIALKPDQKGKAKEIQAEFNKYTDNLKRNDPKTYERRERQIEHVAKDLASVLHYGKIGEIR